MNVRQLLIGCVTSLSLTAGVYAEVSDEAVDQAIATYTRLVEEAQARGQQITPADLDGFIVSATETIAIPELSLEQVQALVTDIHLDYGPTVGAKLDELLSKYNEQTDAEGARAAILKLSLVSRSTIAGEALARYETAINHPALKDAIAAGYGSQFFVTSGRLSRAQLNEYRDRLLALADSVQANSPVEVFDGGSTFFRSVAQKLRSSDAKGFAPLREQFVKAGDEKLAAGLSEKESEKLATALKLLNSAFVRGELVGSVAPELDIVWFHDPANPDRKVTSLADLRGNVVVIDFWATWCGPCISSFPNVRQLADHYKDQNVVILGVTSPQGAFYGSGGKVDTTNAPEKEFELTPAFMTENGVTWPVAYSTQSVFNPEYGVQGIPHVVILDAEGVVRHRGLHPGSSLEDKTKLIDPLLKSAE